VAWRANPSIWREHSHFSHGAGAQSDYNAFRYAPARPSRPLFIPQVPGTAIREPVKCRWRNREAERIEQVGEHPRRLAARAAPKTSGSRRWRCAAQGHTPSLSEGTKLFAQQADSRSSHASNCSVAGVFEAANDAADVLKVKVSGKPGR